MGMTCDAGGGSRHDGGPVDEADAAGPATFGLNESTSPSC